MSEVKALCEQQLFEFHSQYKTRFNQLLPTATSISKVGYYLKLNNREGVSLNMYIPDKFPMEPPIFYVNPKIQDEIIDQNGRIIDDSVQQWTLSSSLVYVIGTILSKLEGNKPPEAQSQLLSQEEDKAIMNDLYQDLSNKSIEELIYISFNPEHYVSQYTQKGLKTNEALLNQMLELNKIYETKKAQYTIIKSNIEKCKNQYEEKENELKNLLMQKQSIDNQISLNSITEELKQYTELTFNKPRQQLMNDFMAKKIDFETFKTRYKDYTMNYYYYSLVKDKLNLCK